MSSTNLTIGIIYLLCFFGAASLVIYIRNYPLQPWAIKIAPLTNLLFAGTLACWMVWGMIANYMWDLFREGKGMADISYRKS
jgi:hypothetical protein